MSYVSPRFTAALSKLTLLSLPLLLAACGGLDAPSAQGDVPALSSTLEAEAAETVVVQGSEFNAQDVMEAAGPTGGETIKDVNASGGQAVNLLSNGSAVRFTLPSGLGAGDYTVQVRGRATAYQGNPIVAVRLNGTEKGRVELSTAGYTSFKVGTLALKAGDVLTVVFVNDAYAGPGKDRNAVVDHLILDPVTAVSAPLPTTPTTPSPTTPTVPTTPITTPVTSPVPVTVPSNALNVKTLGVRGDGVTDDTAALNRVVTQAAGRDIYLPEGTYVVSRPVVWSALSGQTVYASGAALKAAPGWVKEGSNEAVLNVRSSSNVTVRGITIQGFANRSLAFGVGRMDGLAFNAGQNVTVVDAEVRDVQGVGVNGTALTGFRVEGSRILRSHGHGMGCDTCVNSTFVGNVVDGNANPAATSAPTHLIGIGLLLHMGSGAVIENNTFKNHWDTATKAEGLSNVTYRGNTVDVFGKDGIKTHPYPAKGVTQISNVVIENNTISGGRLWKWDGGGSINLQGVSGGRASGNRVTGNPAAVSRAGRGDTGVVVNTYGNTAKNITVENNTIRDVQVGMLQEGESGVIVRKNTFASEGRTMKHAINIGAGAGTVVEDNSISSFSAIAVLVYGGRDTTLQRNSFADGQQGVYKGGESGYRILSNSFAANVSRPLNLGSFAACSGNVGNVPTHCR